MQWILVLAGMIVVILGTLLQLGVIHYSRIRTIRFPGYVYVIVGAIAAVSGLFLT